MADLPDEPKYRVEKLKRCLDLLTQLNEELPSPYGHELAVDLDNAEHSLNNLLDEAEGEAKHG